MFIPTRWSFGLKPDDFAQTMGSAIGMATGGSMHPTLFGDCYANLGWFGILLGRLWAALISVLEKIILSRKNCITMILLYVLCASELCIIGRGAVYNGFWLIAYGSLIILICDYICSRVYIPEIRIRIGSREIM